MNTIYRQMAKVEAYTNAQLANTLEVLKNSYQIACQNNDKEKAALVARKIRDKLLDASDKEMTFDRLQLDTSSPLKLIETISNIFNSEWATYRQSLRDLPEQEGFPFNIVFPVEPNNK